MSLKYASRCTQNVAEQLAADYRAADYIDESTGSLVARQRRTLCQAKGHRRYNAVAQSASKVLVSHVSPVWVVLWLPAAVKITQLMELSMAIGVLFVCLGNICRSPSAQGIFQKMADDAGLTDQLLIDSCGTAPFNVGKPADSRAVAACQRAGYDITKLIARQIDDDDFVRFHYIVPMDHKNLSTIRGWAPPTFKGELSLFMHYCDHAGMTQIPDPYYDDASIFDDVIRTLEKASTGLLAHIRKTHGI